jgi:hypothetical protein
MKMPAKLSARRFGLWNAKSRNTKPSWLLYVQRLTRETQAVLQAAAYFPVQERLLNFQLRGVKEWLHFNSHAAPKPICLRSALIPCKRGA